MSVFCLDEVSEPLEARPFPFSELLEYVAHDRFHVCLLAGLEAGNVTDSVYGESSHTVLESNEWSRQTGRIGVSDNKESQIPDLIVKLSRAA